MIARQIFDAVTFGAAIVRQVDDFYLIPHSREQDTKNENYCNLFHRIVLFGLGFSSQH